MPQDTGSTRFWRSISSKFRGRSNSRRRSSDIGVDESTIQPEPTVHPEPAAHPEPAVQAQLAGQQEPTEPGLYHINKDISTGVTSGAGTYEVDIIAIHGLNGTAFGTWTKSTSNQETRETSSVNWTRDFLPKDIPGARIFTYKYESQVLCSKSTAKIEDFAQKLLFNLKVHRKGQERRPIIFIAHSLGGIICKQALTLAKENSKFNSILDSTVGIVFFGTPHRGASVLPGVADFLGTILDMSLKVSTVRFFSGKTRTDLLQNLQTKSPDLLRITKSFSHICEKFHIVSLYETREQEPLGRLVVDEASAIMGIRGEQTIPRATSHRKMCQFGDSADPDYGIILMEILEMCKGPSIVPSLSESDEACISLFNGFDVHEYRSSLPLRVDGTCQWVVQTPQYKSWVEDHPASLLWMTGPSGYGKTTISSFITERLECRGPSADAETIVCYFFCVDGIEKTKDAKAILRSIIFQILVVRRDLVRHAKPAYEYDKEGVHLLNSYNSLWSIFSDLLCDDQVGSVSVIIDAVDECEKTSRNRLIESITRLIDNLKLSRPRRIKFFITSRPDIMVTRNFNSNKTHHRLRLESQQVEIDADLRRVIGERVRIRAELANAKQDTIVRWENSLIETADRTFLWTKFILDILDEELLSSPGDFDRILLKIPRDLQTAYARLLQKILPDKENLAIKLLRVIIASFRPLSVEELNIIVSLQESPSEDCNDLATLKERYLHTNMEADISLILGSLIRIQNCKVYLVHLSLKEFLCTSILDYSDSQLSARFIIDLEQANLQIASACMRYLALKNFSGDLYLAPTYGESQRSSDSLRSSLTHTSVNTRVEADVGDDSVEDSCIFGNTFQEPQEVEIQTSANLAQHYTFFEYSAIFWTQHFAYAQDVADEKLKKLALHLSDRASGYQCDNWFRFFWTQRMDKYTYPSDFDQLITAGFFDHLTLLDIILSQKEPDQGKSLATALYWASRNGNSRSVVRILKAGVSSNPTHQQAPLSVAAEFGHNEIVNILLRHGRANINWGVRNGKTPLSMAAMNGHWDTVRLLLADEHIEVDAEGWKGMTPLFWAIAGHHVKVVAELVHDGRVSINHVEQNNVTPFALAAEKGNAEIATLLLKAPGIDVDRPNTEGQSPLSRAARFGHIAVIKQLKRSKKLNNKHSHRDREGRNPFAWAAHSGHDHIIRLLLRYDLPGIDEEDEHRWTPLFWALEAPTSSTVETLVKTGKVDVNHRDHSGRTCLSWLVTYNKESFIQALLEAPTIDPFILDNEGLTSLDWNRRFKDRPQITKVFEDYLKGMNKFA